MKSTNFIRNITAFNDTAKNIFTTTEHAEDAVHLFIDHSLSISSNAILLRTAVATLTKGSNAEGKFEIPKPSGATAIIQTVMDAKAQGDQDTYILFTDGGENSYNGLLEIGLNADKTPNLVNWNKTHRNGQNSLLADWLQAQNVKICLLGIGPEAKPMLDHMVGMKNVYAAYIDHSVCTRKIISVVSTLRNIAKKNSSGFSSTRGGVQHVLLMSDNSDVTDTLKNLSATEIDEIEAAIGHVRIADGSVVCASDLKHKIDMVLELYNKEDNIDIKSIDHDIKCGILFGMRLMCSQITPAASVASKHSMLFGYPPECIGYIGHCNAIFSRMAKKGILKKEESTPKDGLSLEIDGVMRKFPKDCAQYSCAYDERIVDIIANDATYCTPIGNFPPAKMPSNKKQKTAVK
jgi:hypothetical protein